MRIRFAKLLSLVAASALAFATAPMEGVRAQGLNAAGMAFWTNAITLGSLTPLQAMIGIIQGSGSGPAALASAGDRIASLARSNPALGAQLMQAMAQLADPAAVSKSNGGMSADQVKAITGSAANLISGMMSDQTLSAGLRTTLATSVVASNDASLVATVTVLVAKDNINNTLGMMESALAKSTDGALVQNVIAAIKSSPDAPANLATTLATAIANDPQATAAAKSGARAGATGTPTVAGGQPVTITLPNPAQTITGSVN